MEQMLQFQTNIFGNMGKLNPNFARVQEQKNKIKSVVKRMRSVRQDKLDTFLQDKLELLKRQ
jgi:hypothetical protein